MYMTQVLTQAVGLRVHIASAQQLLSEGWIDASRAEAIQGGIEGGVCHLKEILETSGRCGWHPLQGCVITLEVQL